MLRPGKEIGHRNRAPLAILLVPWVSGLIASHLLPFEAGLTPIPLTAALLLATVALSVCFWGKPEQHRRLAWLIVFSFGGFMGGWTHGSLHQPSSLPESWSGMPPRQAQLTVEVTRIRFQPESGKAGSCAFSGTIVNASPILADRIGHDLSGFLFKPADQPAVFIGSWVHGSGVLKWGKWTYSGGQTVPGRPLLEWDSGEIIETDNSQVPKTERWRAAVLSAIDSILSLNAPQDLPLDAYLKSMVTGSKSYLDKASKQRFQATGLMHFLAISGFHMSILVLSLVIVGKAARLPEAFAAAAIIAISGAYVWTTGASPSAQRAWIMVLFYFAAAAVRRKPNPYAALVAAACVILWINPTQISDPGFQLSFTIVAGIIGYGTALIRHIRIRIAPDRFLTEDSISRWVRLRTRFYRMLVPPLAISWIAFWISAPLIAFHFGALPLSTFLLNPVLGSLFAVSLITAFLSLALGAIGLVGAAGFVNYAAWLNLGIIHHSTSWLAPVSWLRIEINPSVWGCHTATIGALAILGLFNHHHPRIKLRAFLILPGWILMTLSADALFRNLTT